LCANDRIAVPLAAFPPFLTFERCSPHGECICTRPVRFVGADRCCNSNDDDGDDDDDDDDDDDGDDGAASSNVPLAQVCEIRLAPCAPWGLSSSPFSTPRAPLPAIGSNQFQQRQRRRLRAASTR
jgi:hypothetical protein